MRGSYMCICTDCMRVYTNIWLFRNSRLVTPEFSILLPHSVTSELLMILKITQKWWHRYEALLDFWHKSWLTSCHTKNKHPASASSNFGITHSVQWSGYTVQRKMQYLNTSLTYNYIQKVIQNAIGVSWSDTMYADIGHQIYKNILRLITPKTVIFLYHF